MEAVPKLPLLSFELKVSPENTHFGPKLKQYIAEAYREDPDSYSNEMHTLEGLRSAAVRATTDSAGLSSLTRYFCQLRAMQSRFPMSKGQPAACSFAWRDLYANMSCSLPDIKFEMACILYNIGALHTELGASEPRTSADSLKAACTHYQNAAWAFQQLREQYPQPPGADVSSDIMRLLQEICFAQAQECILEKSIQDSRKPSVIGAVATQVMFFYKNSLALLGPSVGTDTINEVIGTKLYNYWHRYLSFKNSYIGCIVCLYQGMNAEEQQKMGERVAFYQEALEKLGEARKLAKYIEPTQITQEALVFTNDVVEGKRKAAKNENEFIYHEEVPDKDLLVDLKPVCLVKALAINFNDPEISGPDIFSRLVPIGAHEASSMYSEEKAKLLRQIVNQAEAKTTELTEFMSSLQLDQLDVLDAKQSIPQEIVDRCAAMNAKAEIIQTLVDSMNSLAEIISDVEDSLDDIEDLIEEDTANEKEFQLVMGQRPPSIVQTELSREFNKYQEAHSRTNESNQVLHKAMTLHIANLRLLAQPLDVLHSKIPNIENIEGLDRETMLEMRRVVGKAREMQTQRDSLIQQLREAVNTDDITGKLLARSSEPTEEIFKQEIEKHTPKVKIIEQNLAAQENIINKLTSLYASYGDSRRLLTDVLRKRDGLINALITSYDAYEELLGKCQKGLEFYKKLLHNVNQLLARVRSTCQVQKEERTTLMGKERDRPPAPFPSSVPGGPPQTPQLPEVAPGGAGMKLKDYLPYMKNRNLAGKSVIPHGPLEAVKPDAYYPEPIDPTSVRPAPVGSEATEIPQMQLPDGVVLPTMAANPYDRFGAPFAKDATQPYAYPATSKGYEKPEEFHYYNTSFSSSQSTEMPEQQSNPYNTNFQKNHNAATNSQSHSSNLSQVNPVQYDTPYMQNQTQIPLTYGVQSNQGPIYGGPSQIYGGPAQSTSYSTANQVPASYNPTSQAANLYNPITQVPASLNQTNQAPTSYYPNSQPPSSYDPMNQASTAYNPTSQDPSAYNPTSHVPTAYYQTSQMLSGYNSTSEVPTAYYPTSQESTAYNPASQATSSFNPTSQASTYNASNEEPTSFNQQNLNVNFAQMQISGPKSEANFDYSQAYYNTQYPQTSTPNLPYSSTASSNASIIPSQIQSDYNSMNPYPENTAQFGINSMAYNPIQSVNPETHFNYSSTANVSDPQYAMSSAAYTSNVHTYSTYTNADSNVTTTSASTTVTTALPYTYPNETETFDPSLSQLDAFDKPIKSHVTGEALSKVNYPPNYQSFNVNVSSYSAPTDQPHQPTSSYGYVDPNSYGQNYQNHPGYTFNAHNGNYEYNYGSQNSYNVHGDVDPNAINKDTNWSAHGLYTNAGVCETMQSPSEGPQSSTEQTNSQIYYNIPYGYITNTNQSNEIVPNSQQSQTNYGANVNQSTYMQSGQGHDTSVTFSSNQVSTTKENVNETNVDPQVTESPNSVPHQNTQEVPAVKAEIPETIPIVEKPVEKQPEPKPEPSVFDLLSGIDFIVEVKPLMPEIKVPQISESAIIKKPVVPKLELIVKPPPPKEEVIDRPAKKDLFSDPILLNKFTQEVKNVQKLVDSLTNKTPSGLTLLDAKWKSLQDIQSQENMTRSKTMAMQHTSGNVVTAVVPFDDSRLTLKSDSDAYINASYYKQLAPWCIPLVISKNPAEHDYCIFWKAVLENKISCIICLLSEIEMQGKTYWPTAKGQSLDLPGGLKVILDEATCNVHWSERKLTVASGKTVLNVTHYQINVFPAKIICTPLVLLVDKILSQTYENRLSNQLSGAWVQCGEGAGRSAVLSLLIMIMCQVRAGQLDLCDMLDAGFVNLCKHRSNVLEDTKYIADAYRTALFYVQGVLCSGTTMFNGEAVSVPSGASVLPPVQPPPSSSPPISTNSQKQKFSRESFEEMKQSPGLKSGDMKDPLNFLDPLWSLKKK